MSNYKITFAPQKLNQRILLKRIGSPDEVAKVVSFYAVKIPVMSQHRSGRLMTGLKLNQNKEIVMLVLLNIPDEIPQEMISKMLMQFENQLHTAKQLVTKKEKLVPKFGSAKELIKMSADFDEPLDDFADYM
jgi:hypothetical protein